MLQLCHGHAPPFDDVARQWRVLFEETDYKVLTVFLTGQFDAQVEKLVDSDKTVFLEYRSKDLRGLKLKAIREIKRLNDRYNFEFAIAHRYKSIYIACHLHGLPVYGVAHAYGVFEGFWRKRFAYRQRKSLSIFGVSNAIRDDVRQSLTKYPVDKIQTFYNHINIEKYQHGQVDKLAARDVLNIPQDTYVIGNVGRLHPDKDQATLIKGFALAELSDAILVIIGAGRLEGELKALAASLGVSERVLFAGTIPQAWQYFKAFDLFVLTSDHEPFGMVLLEALVAGVDVVTTREGGAAEVAGESETFSVGDSQALAKLMVSCRDNRSNESASIDVCFTDEGARANFQSYLLS